MLIGISPLIGPELLVTLHRMGHGDDIVLADAHFPGETCGQRIVRADGLKIADPPVIGLAFATWGFLQARLGLTGYQLEHPWLLWISFPQMFILGPLLFFYINRKVWVLAVQVVDRQVWQVVHRLEENTVAPGIRHSRVK